MVRINAITVREGSGDELARRFAARAGASASRRKVSVLVPRRYPAPLASQFAVVRVSPHEIHVEEIQAAEVAVREARLAEIALPGQRRASRSAREV